MPNLFTISVASEPSKKGLTQGEINSIIYHDLFDYPLNFADLIKWKSGVPKFPSNIEHQVLSKNGYYFVEGHESIAYQRVLRERISNKKLEIARHASKVLSLIPTVKMIAVTGSLAMQNSTEESDIDLLIVTKGGTLWITRLLSYLVTSLFRLETRRATDRNQKDKLCLNMWIDESDLLWKKSERNIYSAHEIAQMLPLVNKDNIYEKFLFQNKWILNYWPNSVRIKSSWSETTKLLKIKNYSSNFKILEKMAFWIQYHYMKPKISREMITPTRAFFHPQDWGEIVLTRLQALD